MCTWKTHGQSTEASLLLDVVSTAVSWQARCKKDVEISTKQASPRIAWSTTRTRSSDERERGRRCKQYLADLPPSLITSNSLNRSLGHSQRHDIWQNLLVE
ncbi:hypothetical protein D6C83_00074 [Aureobasidium pullulans]|uniref:Uncharacterized protein n=1 Tax=Aureobasidium pullulans TaxID=5580 RepID=A0A4T0ENZ6_AURPU|nr:hypothetical protein D6C83_00074 [Aureobasidium pullulans]